MYYAVSKGRTTGIFNNWNDCNKSITGYPGAIFKKFNLKSEAEQFINKTNNNIDNYFQSFYEDNNKQNISENNIKLKYIYTDGACINNGTELAKAGIGVYFGKNDKRNISETIDGKQTNNTAELKAIIKVYDIIKEEIIKGEKFVIMSDSMYAINSATTNRLEKNKNKEIPNKELVKEIYDIYKNYPNVEFTHIKAHTDEKDEHSLGNEQADILANKAIGFDSCMYNNKIYINVPFKRKDEVKKMEGKWDAKKKKWFIYENNKEKDYLISTFGISK